MFFLLIGNLIALSYAAEPNFDNLRNSDEILDTAKTKTTSIWEYFIWAIELIMAGAFIFALAGYNMTKDEGKAVEYKKWMIRAIIATLILGAYLGYLYS